MKKSKQLVGVGIVDSQNGKIIGKIDNVVFFPGCKKILGFTVYCGKWVKKKKALLIDDVTSIGNDMIMARSGMSLVEYEKGDDFYKAIEEKCKILGLQVITNKGEELGYIEDVIINEKNYCIEGYVLTDGIVEDILKGKSIIPFKEEMIFGEDTVIVNSDYKNVVLKNDISLKKAFKKGRRLKY